MDLEPNRSSTNFEVARYQLSDLERDTLRHYPGVPSPQLVKKLRGSIMVFQNILSELWRRGLTLRIVPKKTSLTDLPECLDLKKFKNKDGKNHYDGIDIAGIYRAEDRRVIIKEEHILDVGMVNQRFWVIVHEFAHAIWYLFLEFHDRNHVTHLFLEEKKKRPDSSEYRLKNELEFFADGFRYYVTPVRTSAILGVWWEEDGKQKIKIVHEGQIAPSKETLRSLNIQLFRWLENKFRGIIDPELVMARQINEYEEECFDMWFEGFYGPVIDLGTITSFDIKVKTL